MPKPAFKVVSWVAQLAAVAIMGQTLYFKFTGAEESMRIFTELGMEPHGRILIGALELLACVLLLIPSSVVWGALLGACLMAGAIIGHLTQLGFDGERGVLASLAMVVLASCLLVLFIHQRDLPLLRAVQDAKPKQRKRPPPKG